MNRSLKLTCSTIAFGAMLLSSLLLHASTVVAQSDQQGTGNAIWTSKRQLDQEFHAQLGKLIDEDKVDVAAKPLLRSFIVRRDEDRQYIFFAPENVVGEDRLPNNWPSELKTATRKVLEAHEERLLKLAKELVADGQGSRAIQLLNELLYFSPNNEEVRKMLGHRAIERDGVSRWRVSKDRLKSKQSRKAHPKFGWTASSWSVVSTAHFQIESKATVEQTEQLAIKLERWHEVWRQLFFDYYNRASNIQRWIDGKSSQIATTRKFKIVFFADREQYFSNLSGKVAGITSSTGYYNDSQKTSYFYASDNVLDQDTWRHELTHQLFQESRQSVKSPFQEQFLWLGEGIAMYFESLVDHGDYITVGGFDSRRLQYARLRRLKEQFRFPLDRISGMTLAQFQSESEIAKIYSQSAGVTHFLMDSNNGSMQQPLSDFLELAYRGKLKSGVFEKVIGKTFDQIESEYETFLKVKPEQIATLTAAHQREELALIGTKLLDDSLRSLGSCTKLRWLDLSGCDVRGKRLQYLKSCKYLRQLFLTGARVDDKAVEILASLRLQEIDLSGSNLKDSHIETLISSQRLKVLNVTSSQVTSHGVKTVASQRPDIELGSNFNSGK